MHWRRPLLSREGGDATEVFWFEAPQDARLEIWKMSITGQMLHVRADVSDYAMADKPAKESLWAS
jgi:hypothetical protein